MIYAILDADLIPEVIYELAIVVADAFKVLAFDPTIELPSAFIYP